MSANISWNSPDIVRDGLVLYLDAGTSNSYNRYSSAGVWKDMSGNGNSGSLVNGPTFNAANGGSIVFDGVDDYINITNNNSINPTSEVSVNCWFNAISYKTLTAVVNRNISGLSGYDLFIDNNKIRFIIRTNIDNNFSLYSLSSILTSVWYYVSLTYVNGNSRIYINSILDNYSSVQIGNIVYPELDPLRIGMDWNTSRCFNGRIPIVQIYNRALSAAEVLQNYNATKGRFGL